MTSLKLESVSFHYGAGTPILRGVDLSVIDGELLCILGKSGSGKSTLLHLVAGLLSPTGGDIVDSRGSLVDIPAHKRQIVLLSQKALLFPFTSVEGNISFSPRLRGVPKKQRRQKVAELLELVNLVGFEKRMPSSLSGGEAQRVALARALAADPTMLLMDEPFSNLDAPIRSELQHTFRQLHEEQKLTTVFVTHQLSEAMSLGDRVAALVDGKLEAVSTPPDMYRRPPTTGAAHLVGVEHWLSGTWEAETLSGSWGEVRLESKPDFDRAVVAARPEHVLIRPLAEARETSSNLVGTIVERRYQGEHYSFVVELGGGTRLGARAVADAASTLLSVGDQVEVQVEPGSWFPLRQSESSPEARLNDDAG